MTDKEVKVPQIEGTINIGKYFYACPDGNGYVFNEHLNNQLLTECINANSVLLERQEQFQRKEQELKNEKEAARIQLEIYDQACLDLKNELDEAEHKLWRLQAKNEELKKANIHIDTNRKCKADKLKRIEELIINCQSGYTDEFIQSILAILLENEPSVTDLSINDSYKQALVEIKTNIIILGGRTPLFEIEQIRKDIKRILTIINEVLKDE